MEEKKKYIRFIQIAVGVYLCIPLLLLGLIFFSGHFIPSVFSDEVSGNLSIIAFMLSTVFMGHFLLFSDRYKEFKLPLGAKPTFLNRISFLIICVPMLSLIHGAAYKDVIFPLAHKVLKGVECNAQLSVMKKVNGYSRYGSACPYRLVLKNHDITHWCIQDKSQFDQFPDEFQILVFGKRTVFGVSIESYEIIAEGEKPVFKFSDKCSL